MGTPLKISAVVLATTEFLGNDATKEESRNVATVDSILYSETQIFHNLDQ